MSASLLHQHHDIEADIRIIMRFEGLTDLSIPACKEWTRALIRCVFPMWMPGHKLTSNQEERLGSYFEYRLRNAKGEPQRRSDVGRAHNYPSPK